MRPGFHALLLLVLSAACVAAPGVRGQTILTPQEQSQLARTQKPNDRMKVVLRAADARMQGMREAVQADEAEQMKVWLAQYYELIRLCSAEMDKPPALKARQAKEHEIVLRRFTNVLDEIHSRMDLTEQKLLIPASDLTNHLRKRLLQLFFGKDSIKGGSLTGTP